MFKQFSKILFTCVRYILTLCIFFFIHSYESSLKRKVTHPYFLSNHFFGNFNTNKRKYHIKYTSRKNYTTTFPFHISKSESEKNFRDAYYAKETKEKKHFFLNMQNRNDTNKDVIENVVTKDVIENVVTKDVIENVVTNDPTKDVVNNKKSNENRSIHGIKESHGCGQKNEMENNSNCPTKSEYTDVKEENTPGNDSNAKLGEFPDTYTSMKENDIYTSKDSANEVEDQLKDNQLAQLIQKKKKKKKFQNEEIRKKLSELAKLRWRNEEERNKLLRRKNQFKHSEKTKQLLSYKIKLKWTDENYRKSIIEKTKIFNQDENTKMRKSILLKEKWKLKEFRNKMLSNRKPFSWERRKKISDIIKQKWQDQDYRQKTLQAIKDNYKKRKLQAGLNPNFNYIQNVMLFKQFGLSAPKIRFFPNIHRQKLRGKKKKKKKMKIQEIKQNYKENWKNIYNSLLDKNEFQHSLTYLNNIGNLSVSTNT
ncbi:hypothetical protein, conserved [Plasmodium gonderi]|uniref:Uncharacterized protein n=1 Tax=Plasmodium gonderi TaxID=77519 RepID=A0A1Y1JKQ4_PLAGO|nr:hypothetical protein, conserved [Plasmodium gonderi]GAW80614.1 hypothetical protein, conserved [Plasmodium gonderi]